LITKVTKADYGVDTFRITNEQLAKETPLA